MTRSTKAITSATIYVTAAQLQSLNLHLLTQSFFLLSETCDGKGFDKNFPEKCNLISFDLDLSPRNENMQYEF